MHALSVHFAPSFLNVLGSGTFASEIISTLILNPELVTAYVLKQQHNIIMKMQIKQFITKQDF